LTAYLVTFLIVLPLIWVVLLSFRSHDSILEDPTSLWPISLENYARVFGTLPLVEMYGNTILLAVTSVGVGTVISFMSSYALSRIVFRRYRALQSAIRIYLLAGLAIPVYILLFPIYRLDMALGLYGSHLSLILPYIAVTLPFNTLLFTGFLADFPGEIEEAAIIDGVGLWRMCWSVVVPIMRPVIATVLIFNLIYVFNEYPFVSILSNAETINTVSLALSNFQGQYRADYGAMMAASAMILIPQLAIYAVFQKHVVAGMTVGAVKG
jgi:raffinose/stachyose/melibiose transport system permease protein